MKQTINLEQFQQTFTDWGCSDNFSYEALEVLYDWFEELDADCGTDTELDVIAICCEFSEATANDIAVDYQIDVDDMNDDERLETVLHYLNYHTTVCGETSDTIVYQNS